MDKLSKQYGTEEKQIELLEMIKEIDQIFTDNHIQYSLCGGSLLGAIRNSGFIPWDDDIDIMMDRSNYNKTSRLFQENTYPYKLHRELWIDRIQKRSDSHTGLQAATIDIFVMDRCPDNAFLRKAKVLMVRVLQGMMKESPSEPDKSLVYRVCLWATYILGRPFSQDKKYEWYKKISQIGNGKKTKYMTGYNDYFNLVTLRYSGKLMDRIIKHPFEDTMLPITAEFNNYLTTQYGDYMTPPPVEERVPLHS